MAETPLWTAASAAAAVEARAQGDWRVSDVAIDTREITPGALFVALQGESRDGHAFVADALAKGAGAAMVSRMPPELPTDAPLLIVDDSLRGLERLAAAARARASRLSAIAVTGSVGKTSTKEMLATALRRQGRTHAAERSFNNHWGVPLTLARMPAETRFGVFEIGMNSPGEITPLSRLARPVVALVTTVEPVHLAGFDGVEAIAAAKAEIFDGLEAGGSAVLNYDNQFFEFLSERAMASGAGAVLSFGARGGDARLLELRATDRGVAIEAEIHGRRLEFDLGARGEHMAMNALAALLTAEAAGANLEQAAEALTDWRPAAGRGDRWRLELPAGGAVLLIDESYNANPTSMRAALGLLAAAEPVEGRRIAFLTDMLELGSGEDALHAALADCDAVSRIDVVHCAGPAMRSLHGALPTEVRGEWFEEASAMADAATGLIAPGDVAMVKGSKGSKAHLVASRLKSEARAAPAEPPPG